MSEPHEAAGPPTKDAAFANELVVECLARVEAEGLSALEEMCTKHPEHAALLRRRMSALARAGFLESTAGDAASSTPTERIPERLGEFRLLTPLGAGGMGVVYLALQESLQRVVALKVVRPEHLFFPGARDRFRREVEAVARLQHPGIVHIHVVGDEQGIPFFAMEPLRGATLGEVIHALADRDPATLTGRDLMAAVERIVAARPPEQQRAFDFGSSSSHGSKGGTSSESFIRSFEGTYVSACLRIVADVAHALDHAHLRGVLHRDLKPNNVMITTTGRVVLLDFGLAAAEGSHQITRSGAQLGSFAYMSPEQIDGVGNVDARSDIYSLGITLYEILTLQLPFQAVAVAELVRLIREGAPESPKTYNSAVPSEVAIVCQVAMDKDPQRRYASAAAFAADLKNLLELKPIVARPLRVTTRVRRFVQRHPMGSVAGVLAFAIMAGVPSLLMLQANAANRLLSAQIRDTENERDRAESNLRRALIGMDAIVEKIGSPEFEALTGSETLRRNILEEARTWYESLLEANAKSGTAALETADACRALGAAATALDDRPGASEAYDRAIQISEILLRYSPNERMVKLGLADALVGRGTVAVAASDLALARKCNERAIALHRSLDDVDRESGPSRRAISGALAKIAHLDSVEGALDRAADGFREAIALMEDLVAEDASPANVAALAQLENNYGQVLRTLQRTDEAVTLFQSAIARLESVADASQDPASVWFQAYSGRVNLVSAMGPRADRAVVEAELAIAVDGLTRLIGEQPRNWMYQRSLGLTLTTLGVAQQRRSDYVTAEATHARAIEVLLAMQSQFEKRPQLAVDCALALANSGVSLRANGRSDRALANLRSAVSWMTVALGASGPRADWQSMLDTLVREVEKGEQPR